MILGCGDPRCWHCAGPDIEEATGDIDIARGHGDDFVRLLALVRAGEVSAVAALSAVVEEARASISDAHAIMELLPAGILRTKARRVLLSAATQMNQLLRACRFTQGSN